MDDILQSELELYELGRQLRLVVISPAWEILIDVLNQYREKAKDELMSLAPGDPTVPTVHAASSAVWDVVEKFQQDVMSAVDFAANPSREVVDYLNGTLDANDVAKAMGQN